MTAQDETQTGMTEGISAMGTVPDPRNDARWKILRAVNNAALRRQRRSRMHRPPARLLGMKHIELAVFRARQRGLVDDATLIAAGYNPRRGGAT